ncbi:MAG: hypothetical protein LBM87_04530 [Ruminococcus sp.]|jgi:hypothetical protein|nr:hypothetical protein [Ruminococcus sp.]
MEKKSTTNRHFTIAAKSDEFLVYKFKFSRRQKLRRFTKSASKVIKSDFGYVKERLQDIPDNKKFKQKLNMDEFSIMNGDNRFRRECMIEIYKRRDLAAKFGVFFAAGVMIFICLNSLLGMFSVLSYQKNPLGDFEAWLIAVPPLVFIPSVMILYMKSAGLTLGMIVCLLIMGGFFLLGSYLIIPVAFVWLIILIRLSKVMSSYETLSETDGFPDFDDTEFFFNSNKKAGQ